ncbi:nicotine N-demethylase CYP82E4-like [Solanum lycopersicum]|uniref:Cytochrome P450 n=1 Tax=Solanum lycopersicum TaxID=4081 RepID=A0A3Q7GZE4_SOLLC|nr:cytochrome P450 82C2-like [Solanum lycopersicum]
MEIHILSHVEAIIGILVFFFLLFLIRKAKTWKNSKKFGPAPPQLPGAWPIIGHLPQILSNTLDGRNRINKDGEIPLAHTLGALADKYGPVFTVRQGMFPIAVVSSYEAIKECFTTQDKNLANRVATCSCKYLGYDHANLTFANYGPYWRMVRKLVVNNLLSSKSLERLKHVRISEVESSIKELYTLFVANEAKNVPTKVDIGHWFDDMMLNITVKMIGGKRYSQVNNKEEEKEEAERFRKAFNETMYYIAIVGIEDAFPFPLLQWLDLQGNIKVMKRIADEMDVILQRWLDDHTNKRKNNESNDDQDLIDIMLTELDKDDFQYGYSRETIIKATMLTIVSDATHTTAVHLIWIIACLLNNKHVLEKVHEEIDTKVGKDRWVEDSDIKNLMYFQATIKEVLRLYPPSPMLVHEALADCQVLGYHISKGTRLFVNVWKLQKDSKFWPEPEKFLPERFLTTKAKVDVYGKDLEFIPFGSGRRSCPGITMAMQVTYLSIARLLQAFDFDLPNNDPLDMTEGPGFTAVKKVPLEVVVKPRMLPMYYGT